MNGKDAVPVSSVLTRMLSMLNSSREAALAQEPGCLFCLDQKGTFIELESGDTAFKPCAHCRTGRTEKRKKAEFQCNKSDRL